MLTHRVKQKFLRHGMSSLAAAALLLSGGAIAAEDAAAQGAQNTAAEARTDISREQANWAEAAQATKLKEQPVFGADGKQIGTVRDVVRNTATQQLALVIERQAQQGPQRVTVPFSQAKLAVTLDAQTLAAMPEYEAQRFESVALADAADETSPEVQAVLEEAEAQQQAPGQDEQG